MERSAFPCDNAGPDLNLQLPTVVEENEVNWQVSLKTNVLWRFTGVKGQKGQKKQQQFHLLSNVLKLLAGIAGSFNVCWDSKSGFAVDGTSWHLKILCCIRSPWGLTACWWLVQWSHWAVSQDMSHWLQSGSYTDWEKSREGGRGSPQPSVLAYLGPWLVLVGHCFLT